MDAPWFHTVLELCRYHMDEDFGKYVKACADVQTENLVKTLKEKYDF